MSNHTQSQMELDLSDLASQNASSLRNPTPSDPESLVIMSTRNGWVLAPMWPLTNTPNMSEAYVATTMDDVANILTLHYGRMLKR